MWAALAPDDDEEEEEEAASAAAPAASASAVPASAAAAAAGGAPGKTASGAAAAGGIATRAEDLLPGTGEPLDTDDAVKEKCSAIAASLRLTTDVEEALRGICELRCVPVGRRERIVDVLLQVCARSGGVGGACHPHHRTAHTTAPHTIARRTCRRASTRRRWASAWP